VLATTDNLSDVYFTIPALDTATLLHLVTSIYIYLRLVTSS